jgi:AcrR family transcriptional regulator
MAERDGRLYGGESLHARRRDQRQRLLAAARDVFAESGYAAASIEEVVSRARVSRTSFYRFFAGKEDCMLAVLDEAVSGLMEAFATAAAAEDPEERIRLGVRGIVEGLASEPATARVVLVEAVGASPAIEDARIRARAQFARLLEQELRRYPGWIGHSPAEIELTALATMAAVAEAVADLVAHGRADRWETLVEPLTRFAIRALTPQGESAPTASEVAAAGGGVGSDELRDQA